MLLPVVPKDDIVLPTLLAGAENGRLIDALLEEIQPGVWLMRDAARSWRVMRDRARADGVELVVQFGYRDYATQKSIFLNRYVTEYIVDAEQVVWNGQRYFKLPNVASAAVPGTSNHGWGLAVDIVRGPGAVEWLVAHAHEDGWCAELQSEPWHWLRFAGNYTEPPEDDDMGKVEWRILAPAGSAAKFIAPMAPLPDGTLAALYATWLPSGPHVDEWSSRGVPFLPCGVEDLRNVTLLGPLPTGDAREWTAADWLAVA